ncbi:MAG: sigma-54-dependent Fis family transcriptional regulator [Gemmatimonadota bacterium]|nr:MAG: sigma-54-dependent Fis family transcriptional regulator [Gemmatimonadota bacterium]
MERFHDLLFGVWREACRHIELSKSVGNIAVMLAGRLLIEQLFVQRIDASRRRVETVAAGPTRKAGERATGRRDWTDVRVKRLLRWCREGRVAVRRAGEQTEAAPFDAVPDGLSGDLLVAPLAAQDHWFGLLVLHARRGASFSEKHAELCEALMEPFAVALENDRRLRELRALREAAEAEKRSLLTKLGRRELLETIVGAEGGLRPVMERVELVAPGDAPVLIFGETGSGKEVIARAIHVRSVRVSAPFIRVNCGAIPPGLIDSELFGHEKGSFTGATSTRRGWFERADGGTLFLDEIGELATAAQVRLLGVLQDGTLERVGGERPIKVDVRIVAATHRDLAGMVQNGEFREDLWYRIAVFPIVLPPLRERLQDIAALAEHFTLRAATRFGLRPQTPTPEHIALLSSYHWPGNVRELASVLDRAAILGDGDSLQVAKALGVVADVPALARRAASAELAQGEKTAEILPLDEAMKRHIERALVVSRGRVEGPQGAATLLGINPHTLRARMRRLGVDWASFRHSSR